MELLRTVEPVTVIGLDNMNDYYNVSIKDYRLAEIEKLAAEKRESRWEFVRGNLADTSDPEQDFGFKPATSLREGLRKFARWYKDFYQNEL